MKCYQVLNNHGYPANDEAGDLSIFETQEAANNHIKQLKGMGDDLSYYIKQVILYELKKQTFAIEWGVDGQLTQDYKYNTEEEANAFFEALLESDGWIDFKVTKEPEIWDISKQLIKDLKQEDKNHEENTRINND